MHYKFLAILSFAMLFTACKNDNLIRRGDSVEVAFNKAKAVYNEGDYADAASAFETVVRVARGTELGKDSQYFLAESYYRSRQYLLAASEYDRYISYYPRDERREELEFKAAMCYYNRSPRYQLDQSETLTAIERFQLFNTRYPNSELVSESADHINELRAKLGHKIYSAAEFYARTQQYEAATIYYGLTIDRYPETKWAERALVEQIKTFIEYADNSIQERQAERYQKAIEGYEKYIQLYPQGNARGEVESYHDDARQKMSNIQRTATTATNES